MKITKRGHRVAATAACVAAFLTGMASAGVDYSDAAEHTIDVNSRGVVQFSSLNHCPTEDSGRFCTWNVDPRHRDGNGRGLAFWRGQHGHAHYVWPLGSHPARAAYWSWVRQPLADALAEGETRRDGTDHWGQCIVHIGDTTVVRCADGTREVS